MFLLILLGVCAIAAGAVAILFGIPVKEFSFGNTLILAGAGSICTGLILFGLALVVRQLKRIALELEAGDPVEAMRGPPGREVLGLSARHDDDEPPQRLAPRQSRLRAATESRAEAEVPSPQPPVEASPSWREEPAAEPPPAKARRNLLFSSSRKDRGEVVVRPDPASAGDSAAPTPPVSETRPPSGFEPTWPPPERARAGDALRRDSRPPPPPPETDAAPATPPQPQSQAVTILKSGTVDGMTYSLYSDGSIEAQMPEGTMRFASIDELRTHLEQRA